jgi:hypothetical protein
MSKQTELAQIADTITVNSGKIGIGASSPDSRLTVQSPDNTLATDIFKFTSLNGAAGLKFGYQRIEQISASTPITFNTGGSESMRIDSAGRVTKPSQPAFVAHTTPSTFTNNVDIIWSATALNRGSVYNTSNGRFTAPIAGLYQFFASVRIEHTIGTVSYHRISFRHNGSYVQSSRSQLSHRTATGYYSHCANDQAIYLNVNDYVNVMFETGGGASSFSTAANNEHVFYGYLIG